MQNVQVKANNTPTSPAVEVLVCGWRVIHHSRYTGPAKWTIIMTKMRRVLKLSIFSWLKSITPLVLGSAFLASSCSTSSASSIGHVSGG